VLIVELEIGAALAIDEGPSTVHDELLEAPLDQGGQLEPAAELVDNLIALERFDHGVIGIGTGREEGTEPLTNLTV
jgi:hypothetical protein